MAATMVSLGEGGATAPWESKGQLALRAPTPATACYCTRLTRPPAASLSAPLPAAVVLLTVLLCAVTCDPTLAHEK